MSKSQPDPLESLSDERTGPTLGADEMEVVIDASEQRPDSGLHGAAEMRWLPLAGLGLAVVLGGALALTASVRQPGLGATVVAAAEDTGDAAKPAPPVDGPTEPAPTPEASDATEDALPTAEAKARPARASAPVRDAVLAHAGEPGSAPAAPSRRGASQPSPAKAPSPSPAAKAGNEVPPPSAPSAPTRAEKADAEAPARPGSPLLDLPPPPEDDDDAAAPAPDTSSTPADDDQAGAGDEAKPADEDEGLPPPPDPSA